jgi:hypothetical protein
MEAARPLVEIVNNQRWMKRLRPFPHVVVPDLFVPSVAEEIHYAVRKIIDDTTMNRISNYDASGSGLSPDTDWPLRLFLTPGWRELVSGALDVETVPFVNAGVHHHAEGGKSGTPHNDLNPVYFADSEPRDGIVATRDELVDLKSGRVHKAGTPVVRHVRAVSIIYYTANPEWHPGLATAA